MDLSTDFANPFPILYYENNSYMYFNWGQIFTLNSIFRFHILESTFILRKIKDLFNNCFRK